MNIVSGTAVLAQFGFWLFLIIVWYFVLSTDIILPSYHPLFNTVGALLLINAILLLQPTHTQQQKREGTISHSVLMSLSLACFLAGVVIIWYNKHIHNSNHYESTHGKLGLITTILLVTQAFIGATQYYLPQMYGGVENAKKLYKYHRVFGYALSGLVLVTATYGTQSPWFLMKLNSLWIWIVLDILVVAGLLARVKPAKMKFY
jgi:hypothetical protein